MFITDGIDLLFCIFCDLHRASFCVSGVGSFLMQSGGSLIFSSSFRCRRLALNKEILLLVQCRHMCLFGQFTTIGGSLQPKGCPGLSATWGCQHQGILETSAQVNSLLCVSQHKAVSILCSDYLGHCLRN